MFRTLFAEVYKQHKMNYHSNAMYFSLFLWPILNLITIYYLYKPFENIATTNELSKWVSSNKIFLFLTLGYVTYMFFRVFVQSAWMFSNERIQGTLELIYLTNASRLSIVFGSAIASLFDSLWMFAFFCFGSIFVFSGINISSYYMVIIAILAMIIPSLCWGALLNSITLISRDIGGLLFTILDEPMEIFSGVKIPFSILPFWAKIIGIIFPLTWSLEVTRKIFMDACTISDIWFDLLILSCLSVAMIIITKFTLDFAEKHSKRMGNMGEY